MKKLIYIFCLLLSLVSKMNAQLPSDYPFKTLVDEYNNLLVTGYDLNNDFFITKYPQGSTDYIWYKPYANAGNDRGMDVAIDTFKNVIACGYIYNSTINNNDIFIFKLNGASGDTIWSRKFNSDRDEKSFGIVTDEIGNIYVAGYTESKYNHKDIIILKYNSAGALQWEKYYDNPVIHGDDVATDILIDDNFIYITGYTYNGDDQKNDIIMMSCRFDGSAQQSQIYEKEKTNEIPTGFVISEYSTSIAAKSRLSITSTSDNSVNPNYRDFLTLAFNSDNLNTLLWANIFNGNTKDKDTPTGIAADELGNVYVTGYSYISPAHKFDFASMKYERQTGAYIWNPPVNYFDSSGGNDKSSSIKVKDNVVYIAGSCDSVGNGYYVSAFNQNGGGIEKNWSNTFVPSFSRDRFYEGMNSAANLEHDNLGNTYLISFKWDGSGAYYAIAKYDINGNLLYTIDNINRPADSQINNYDNTNSIQQTTANIKDFRLEQNYPNPFNPNTIIGFSIPENVKSETSNVKLIIFNTLGNEVANLVNEKKNAGSYEVEFDGSKLSSGIYFVSLLVNGNVIDTKSMVLVK